MSKERIISWFSFGAPSAVASMLAIKHAAKTGEELIIANCEIHDEHPDNKRFLRECEEWFGQKVLILGNDKYGRSVEAVCDSVKYIVSPSGAPCTGELKKEVRKKFQRPNDRHIFGYTIEEQKRVDDFIDANADIDIWPILIEAGLDKTNCKGILDRAGIELPEMYKMGFKNNNCIGCVKGSAGYFNKIRVEFPEVFESRAKLEERRGGKICKIRMPTVKKDYPDIYLKLGSPALYNKRGNPTYWRPTLRELPEDAGDYPNDKEIECGIFCEMASQDIADGKL